MTPKHPRPLSPHLTIWKWGPHMLVSILHRITGGALTALGLVVLTWWLVALAGDEAGYDRFVEIATSAPGLVILIGLTWAFWQHLFSGLRHLVLDIGAGFELKINKFWSIMTIAGSLLATAATWFILMGVGQ